MLVFAVANSLLTIKYITMNVLDPLIYISTKCVKSLRTKISNVLQKRFLYLLGCE
jgi:hypothetical protein